MLTFYCPSLFTYTTTNRPTISAACLIEIELEDMPTENESLTQALEQLHRGKCVFGFQHLCLLTCVFSSYFNWQQ
jgi:hypothetical protein